MNTQAESRESFTDKLPSSRRLQASHLSIRRFEPADTSFLHELATDEDVATYVPWAKSIENTHGADNMIANFDGQWQQSIFARYLIAIDDEPCGYIGLWRDDKPGVFEIGFALLPRFRGQGIIAQVLTEVEELAVDNLQASRLVAHVNPDNAASKHALEKQGFAPTDEFNNEGERRYEKNLD